MAYNLSGENGRNVKFRDGLSSVKAYIVARIPGGGYYALDKANGTLYLVHEVVNEDSDGYPYTMMGVERVDYSVLTEQGVDITADNWQTFIDPNDVNPTVGAADQISGVRTLVRIAAAIVFAVGLITGDMATFGLISVVMVFVSLFMYHP